MRSAGGTAFPSRPLLLSFPGCPRSSLGPLTALRRKSSRGRNLRSFSLSQQTGRCLWLIVRARRPLSQNTVERKQGGNQKAKHTDGDLFRIRGVNPFQDKNAFCWVLSSTSDCGPHFVPRPCLVLPLANTGGAWCSPSTGGSAGGSVGCPGHTSRGSWAHRRQYDWCPQEGHRHLPAARHCPEHPWLGTNGTSCPFLLLSQGVRGIRAFAS